MLLCEIACCILLNVRLNNYRPQLLAVASEGPVKLKCRHGLRVRSISDPAGPSLALLMSASGSPPHSQRSVLLLLAVRITVALSSSLSLTLTGFPSLAASLSCPLYLSTHLLSLGESVALRGRASFFWKAAIGHDMTGQGTNQ